MSGSAYLPTIVALVVVGLGAVVTLARWSSGRRRAVDELRRNNLRFDVADERVVLHNSRYLEITGLAPEFMRPGRALIDILRLRQAQGTFYGDVETYRRELREHVARGKSQRLIMGTDDGRIYQVVNVPMAGGGWLATHEDITEHVNAKHLIEAQKLHLDAALANMSQGLCMFDAERRLIVCNRQYAELYGLTAELTRPGTPLRAILEHQVAVGNTPGRPDTYVDDRLAKISGSRPYHITNRLHDGRLIAVVHQPMAGGGWVATHEDVTGARQREESFRLLFENSPVPMWVLDRDSLAFLAVNAAAIAHYGYCRDEFLAMTVPMLHRPEERDSTARRLRGLPVDALTDYSTHHTRADGSFIAVNIYSRALTYAGRGARLAAVYDITHAKLAEEELRRTKKFLDAVVEHVPLPIAVKNVSMPDPDGHGGVYTFFNRAYEDLTGRSRDELVGRTAHEIYLGGRAELVIQADIETLKSDHAVTVREHPLQTAGNGTRIVTAKKALIRGDDGQPQYLLTTLEDVTERRRAEQRIAHLAHNDSLTDLPNRASFIECLAATIGEAATAGEPFALMCIDLDRFKEANDVYGHLIGDGLLREAARRLQGAAGDAFLARVGGDEFTLIVTGGAQPETAEALGEQLLAAFRDDFVIDGHRLQIGMSAGVALYPTDGADARTLIANADAALYQAKAEMRGSIRLFEEELGSRLRERRDLQNDLRAAIQQGDIFLHYQPQQKIGTGETIGFEALARWQTSKRGMVPPGTFIPIAEESCLIIPLGEWILREACREAASWARPLKVAVNISPVQFHHGDLPRLIHSILLETGLAPQRLELEITEGVLIDDFPRAISILHKLKALGVHIAMDDFGSGYSSLSYLHAFPLDKIKIDRVFVGDLEDNHHSMAIVRAIIPLGHSLNVPILAEGVENEAQRAFLVQEGCDEVQGYLTGRPQPIEAYAELVGWRTSTMRDAALAG